MSMEQIIEGRLNTLAPQVFEFRDDSHLHAGHAGNTGGGHYAVLVVSETFAGLSRVNRQRMVKELLHDLFSDGLIHALSIKAATPDEYFNHPNP
ncbi:BolA/YrbA family protein [Neisseria animaloris]|uniref:BolA/YrbA family protein n=1 Tax=Neisseria animaloris TaxID=326522 RepID=A0A1X3CMB4_9NEIS|nr:BolA family protein [Neisseria animaloris]MDO5074039.1 BolA family protein [Neisseria animaloris]OSI08683.1 BolA family transcriptional regulator [Neisseria animaloris]VEH87367.1 BolA/YrbA family protein [Neisseria animaloris]VEJ20490.1 BolA/YrbA family protein [Neisseria animaloris]